MKRILSATTAAAGAVLVAAIALAPAAHAGQVTNPADNPHEITVEGDDGNTYTDGLDTLPGYDDYECTYIPGAWFDFDSNRVYYADGQSIPWTEWSRATGYQAWLANKDQSGSGGGSSNPAPTKTTKASGTKAPSSGTSSSSTGKSSGGSSATTNKAGGSSASTVDGTAATPGATSTAAAAPQGSAGAATPEASASGAATDASIAPGAAGDSADVALASSTESGGRSAAGLLVLVGLVVLGGLAVAGRSIFSRSSRKGVTQ